MNPFDAMKGRDFDCQSDAITCRMDRAGATIHVVSTPSREVRVLSHSAEDARHAAFAYSLLPAESDHDGELSL